MNAKEYYNLGQKNMEKGEYTRAIENFTAAIALSKNNKSAYNSRGRAKRLLQRYDSAIKDYSSAISIDKKVSAYFSNRGGAYATIGKTTLGISDCLDAIKLDPNNEQAYNNLAWNYEVQKNFSKAKQYYAKALEVNPSYEEVKPRLKNVTGILNQIKNDGKSDAYKSKKANERIHNRKDGMKRVSNSMF